MKTVAIIVISVLVSVLAVTGVLIIIGAYSPILHEKSILNKPEFLLEKFYEGYTEVCSEYYIWAPSCIVKLSDDISFNICIKGHPDTKRVTECTVDTESFEIYENNTHFRFVGNNWCYYFKYADNNPVAANDNDGKKTGLCNIYKDYSFDKSIWKGDYVRIGSSFKEYYHTVVVDRD